MGYRDDFYTQENIVGYTGVLDDGTKPPSVYFVQRVQNGVFYGHITQYYDDPKNVGREPVRRCSVYAITNQDCQVKEADGRTVTKYVAHECITNAQDPREISINGSETVDSKATGIKMGKGFTEVHPSRNPFFLVNAGNRPILEDSIPAHPELKPKNRRARRRPTLAMLVPVPR